MSHFRAPEQVAPGLGMTKTELRRYCKESGIYTRLSRNRIVLDEEDEKNIVAWVKTRNQQPATTDAGDLDNFA